MVLGTGIAGVAAAVKPRKIVFYPDRLTLLANFLAKEHTFYWKDISEIKAITGRSTYGIVVTFKDVVTYSASSFMIPGLWDMDRPEMINRMKSFVANTAH